MSNDNSQSKELHYSLVLIFSQFLEATGVAKGWNTAHQGSLLKKHERVTQRAKNCMLIRG